MKAWFAAIPVSLKLLVLLGSALCLLLLAYLLYRLVNFWLSLNKLKLKYRFAIKNEVIKTTAQILGGAFLLLGLYFTWSNLVATQDKNITELYTKAIGQLGSDKLEVRLGGIYALERIARSSDKDYWPIMQVLTAYIRVHAKCEKAQLYLVGINPPKLRPDIEAIIKVIQRRQHKYGDLEDERLDLSRTNICKSNFIDAHLEEAIFFKANLRMSLFRKAQMQEAMLGDANLQGARMEEANLSKCYMVRANLSNAQLRKSILKDANLDEAKLWGTNLEGADLTNAKLNEASLRGANLKAAKLYGAIFEKADLTKAILIGVDLRNAKGLTREQLATAIIDKNTELPDYLKKPQTEKPELK